jgi:rod shape-determining protein MreD
MSKFINIFLFFIAATIVHWFFIEIFAPFDITVGVMLVFSLVMAYEFPRILCYTFAFFSGLFLDFLSNVMFGGYALAFTIIIFAFSKISEKIDFKEIGPQIVISAFLNMALLLLYGFIGKIFTGTFLWQGTKSFFVGSIIGGIFLPVLYSVARKYFILSGLKK